ncbi:DUF21 domain-containing protein [Desulfobulbus alkaliphilus]|uniref:DUF21 domain-containing protein n=1 Tax=Desulfobulbus alkaliphilus TaxID=869814 RepID=UPI001962AE47|nr:DUF21 domain-containing protein [Desulfobulbus alkaliphilus]MBM9536256.1 DUF21 domain-containing protein [Desulfobulbus alkaliphilus]
MVFLFWCGIFLCLSQSAILSGMNLGLFSLSRMELNVAARKGDPRAKRILSVRKDANFALVTILWGNVGVNVLLALLSGSVLHGVAAFLFSTVIITVFAEIIPQAYFTRHAMRLASLLLPVLRCYQIVLYPVARPTAWLLDRWLGGEEMRFFRERDLRRLIELHLEAAESEIDLVEGQGALNFLEMDDVPLNREGEIVDENSIIRLEFKGDRPVFPCIQPSATDSFLQTVNRSGKSWVVLADLAGEPKLVLNAADFTREAIFTIDHFNPHRHCHRPIIVRKANVKLGEVIPCFQVRPGRIGDDIIEKDVILLWDGQPRIVTGTDILGRLLRGIARPPAA